MKINSHIVKASVAAVAAITLASCSGTSVKLPQSRPAELNMHRGSTVSISYSGALADRVTDELIRLIRSDGYYTHVTTAYPNPAYSINVVDSDNNTVRSVIRVGRYGPVLWRSSNEQLSWGDVFNGKSMADTYAQNIYHKFVPHETTYKVRMKPDEKKNPTLARAVEMAKIAQWDQAKALAAQAVQEHPEDPEAHFVLGSLLRNDSRYDESDAEIKQAMTLDPKDSRFTWALKKNNQMRTEEAHVIHQLQGN